MSRQRIEPQRGCAFVMSRGETLRDIDPSGEQVADFVAFALADAGERLSSGRTFDYNNTIYLSAGHVLYSNRSRALLTITADTVGRHDFLYTPCSQETFDILYRVTGHHPSCLENLATNLRPFGIGSDLVIGLTACSAEMSNNYRLKPIEFDLRAESDLSVPAS